MVHETHADKFISARSWARRWDCSLSSVRRAAERFPIRRVYVGEGRNGLVRYSLDDIVELEKQNEFRPVEPSAGSASNWSHK